MQPYLDWKKTIPLMLFTLASAGDAWASSSGGASAGGVIGILAVALVAGITSTMVADVSMGTATIIGVGVAMIVGHGAMHYAGTTGGGCSSPVASTPLDRTLRDWDLSPDLKFEPEYSPRKRTFEPAAVEDRRHRTWRLYELWLMAVYADRGDMPLRIRYAAPTWPRPVEYRGFFFSGEGFSVGTAARTIAQSRKAIEPDIILYQCIGGFLVPKLALEPPDCHGGTLFRAVVEAKSHDPWIQGNTGQEWAREMVEAAITQMVNYKMLAKKLEMEDGIKTRVLYAFAGRVPQWFYGVQNAVDLAYPELNGVWLGEAPLMAKYRVVSPLGYFDYEAYRVEEARLRRQFRRSNENHKNM